MTQSINVAYVPPACTSRYWLPLRSIPTNFARELSPRTLRNQDMTVRPNRALKVDWHIISAQWYITMKSKSNHTDNIQQDLMYTPAHSYDTKWCIICRLDEKWHEIIVLFYWVNTSLIIMSWPELSEVSRSTTNALKEESDAFLRANSLFPNTISSNFLTSIGLDTCPPIPAKQIHIVHVETYHLHYIALQVFEQNK